MSHKNFNDENYKQENYKYVGRVNVSRKDAAGIVSGKTMFLDDYAIPGKLYAKTLRSPYSHAKILNIDTTEAEKLPGVKAVLTYKDVDPRMKLGWPSMKPFMGQEVMYVGDNVALIAAETKAIAEEAMDLIKVEYEELPAVLDALEATKPGAPELYPEVCPNNICPPGYPPFQPDGPFWHLEKGDLEKGFEECEYIAEDTVEFSKMCAPAAPESPCAIAKFEGGNKFTVWVSTQSAFICHVGIMMVCPFWDVDVRTFNVGGSYGNKQSQTVQVVSAMLLSMRTGRPVELLESKEENMCAFETRLGTQVHARIGMDKEGVVKAVKAKWTVNTGCFSNATQGQIGVGIGEAQLVMAKCPNWDLDTELIVTHKQPAGIVRGYGGQELNSCLSLLMARTMRTGNFDPVECFKKNYVSNGDIYTWRDGREWMANGMDYKPAIDMLAEKFDWKNKWKGWGVPTWTSPDGKIVRGVGCGIIGNADIGEDNTEAIIRIAPHPLFEDKAKIVIHTDITESGMGQRSNIIKMVADVLKVPYDCIEVTTPSLQENPTGMGLCGSRGTITFGHAVSSAAEAVRDKLFELAKPYLGVATDSMYLRDFGVANKARPYKFVPWKKLLPQFLSVSGYGSHLENFSTPSMFMVFVEVQVNKETGKVDVLKCLGGSDCGQIIDPSMLEMQAQGGIGSASLDTATFEEHIIDPVTHRNLSYDMVEYKWRPFNEMPEYESHFMESQWDTFQFHAMGIGEITGGAAASAVMQAISNAIGVEVATYPATPDVILKALKEKE